MYLGRPWREYAKVVILDSWLGAHIRPEGWDDWSKEGAHQTAYYAEYQNSGPGAGGNRVSWSHMLSEEEAGRYTKESVLGDNFA